MEFLNTLKECLLKAGEITLKHFGNLEKIDYKSIGNPVTAADRQSEELIINTIRKNYPSHAILAEESGKSGIMNSEFIWIIDPLDGTVNFSHSMPQYAVSIGLMEKKEMIAGGVYNPVTSEMFYAVKGEGAYLNERRIQVSSVEDIGKSLLITGFPYDRRENPERYSNIISSFLSAGEDVRRFGAAALDLCSIACGRADGFWEEKLNPWDTSAGWLIVEEAGGKVTEFSGETFNIYSPNILVSNGKIHNAMMNVLRGALDYEKTRKG